MKNISKKRALIWGKLIFFCWAIFCCFPVSAASYDYYVNGSYEGGEEGTQEKPFKKISDAISAAGSGDKIFLKNGDYGEKVSLKKGVGLYGESKSKVILSGGVEMKDGSSIENLTVQGRYTAVLIFSGSNARIENCDIKKFGKMGINAVAGSGKVIVRKSSVYGGEGKGFYIEQGRGIEISQCQVYGNAEEGIDIRAKTNGFVKNNSIYSNGESGIEVVLGSSHLVISGNLIQKNGASGIASQFYEETASIGKVSIENNTISKNRKYGLDCALPSGGKPTSSYWKESIAFSGNKLEANGIKSINDFCKIIDAVAKTEKEAAEKEADQKILESEEEALAREQARKDEAAREKTQMIQKNQEEAWTRVNEKIEIINSAGKIKVFFWGTDFESLAEIKREIRESDSRAAEMKKDLGEIRDDQIRQEISLVISELEKRSGAWESFVKEKEKQKGVWKNFLEFLKLS